MFQKLARATIFAASVLLVMSRIASSPHPIVRASPADGSSSAHTVFVVSQLQIRRS